MSGSNVVLDKPGFDFINDSTSVIDHTLFQYEMTQDHLTCPICQLPFINPYVTTCGHTFCRTCIDESLKMTGMKCPLDRTPLEDASDIYAAPVIIKSLIDELEIKCLNDKRGCDWTGPRWEIKKHLVTECKFTRFECTHTYEGDGTICGRLTERRYLDNSEDGCVHKAVECDCGATMMLFQQPEHLENDCSLRPVQCQGCNLSFTRKELGDHEAYCEKQYMKCQASKFGCDWKGTQLLFETVHQRNCQFIKLSAYLEAQESKIDKLANTNRSLQSQISTILDSVIQDKVTHLGFGLNCDDEVHRASSIQGEGDDNEKAQLFMELEKLKMDIYKLQYSSFEAREHNSPMVFNNLMNENSRIKEELRFQKGSINSLRQQLHFLLMERRRPSSAGLYGGLSNYSSDDENTSSSSVNGFKL